MNIKQLTLIPQKGLRKKSHGNFKIHGSKRKDNITKFITQNTVLKGKSELLNAYSKKRILNLKSIFRPLGSRKQKTN